MDIVKRKEAIVCEIYVSDKDLFCESQRYIASLNDIFSEIQ